MLDGWIGDADETRESVEGLTRDFEGLALAIGDIGKGFRKFNKTNEAFKDHDAGSAGNAVGVADQDAGGFLTVAEAWGKINPQMKNVAKELKEMLRRRQNNFNQTAKEINAKEIRPKLKADKRDAEAKIRDINRQLTQTHNKKTVPSSRPGRKRPRLLSVASTGC